MAGLLYLPERPPCRALAVVLLLFADFSDMSLPVSPLAPRELPDLPPIAGIRLASAPVGGYYGGRRNVLLLAADSGCQVAGVFTKNRLCGDPVTWSREVIRGGALRALLVNAGNANVAVGAPGMAAIEAKTAAVGACLGVPASQVAVASTGVIGQPLDPKPYVAALDGLAERLSERAWLEGAEAIMTTDTFKKAATAQCEIDGVLVTINGIAKGSGMIEPNMATMLAFVATDAKLDAGVLDALLREAVATTLNAVTVDGDTSTSDMCLLMASGAAGNADISDAQDARLDGFQAALEAVLRDLAILIARDGEGAQKLITIDVTGAKDEADAMLAAKTIANSPLVKTAIAGEDANWGRIAMAVGRSGAEVNTARLAIAMGGTAIVERGGLLAGYDEAPVAEHLRGREITLTVDLGVGHGKARVWTCDLTHGYIDINADYRS